jgi:ATP-dependent RNA helicase DDX31/DBP7
VLHKYNWNECGRRLEDDAEKTMAQTMAAEDAKQGKPADQILFDGNICKLHGEMEHEQRKKNFFAFDKAKPGQDGQALGSVMICTDVASRGLDFKSITWVIQYDASS